MTIQQFFIILWARRRAVLYTFLVTVIGTAVVNLLLPDEYVATTAVVVDVKSPDPIAGIILPGLIAPGYMATQVDIITSDRVAQRVVRMLKMDQSPAIQERWRKDTEGKGDIVSWFAGLVQKKLDVKPSREGNVINISYSGSDPAFAAALANGFAQAYIETMIELRTDPARQYAQWFDGQLKAQRERLEAAQKALSDYQQKTGIVATDERLDYEMQKLNDLSIQLTKAEADGADSSSKQKSGGADTLPEVMQNPVINQLKTNIALAEAKLKDLSGNVGVNHPQYQRATAEVAELKQRLKEETAKVTASVNTAGSISKQRGAELRVSIESQKRKVLELKKRRDEINVLLRDVETAQKAFDAIGQRLTQSDLEAKSIQTNVSVLTPAAQPTKPAKPRVLLNILISVFLGTLLGAGLALLLELGNRCIRSQADLLDAADLPVLAVISSPKQKPGHREWLRGIFRRRSAGSALNANAPKYRTLREV